MFAARWHITYNTARKVSTIWLCFVPTHRNISPECLLLSFRGGQTVKIAMSLHEVHKV